MVSGRPPGTRCDGRCARRACPGTIRAWQTAERYARFAQLEARGESPLYEEWADGVAGDAAVLRLVDGLPPGKRQPNLVFAASRHGGAPEEAYPAFRAWLLEHWPAVRGIAMTHSTQTNEARRCAVLLPLLATLPQPLALLEVGAAAGLCLYPDRWSYRYDEGERHRAARRRLRGTPHVHDLGESATPGGGVSVAWRAGIDLDPLDARRLDDATWLRALIWPGAAGDERRARLEAGIRLVHADPPLLETGDLTEPFDELAARAPADATLVVFHTAVLAYVDAPGREAFARNVQRLPGHWIANEGPSLLSSTAQPDDGRFLLTLDGEPRALDGAARPVAGVAPAALRFLLARGAPLI